MPGRLFLTAQTSEVAAFFQTTVPGDANDPPRYNIAPGQEVWAMTSEGLKRMWWGIIPVGRKNARGRPVLETIVNARSETVFEKSAFEGVRRAIVPASGWYEWTGVKRRKIAWRITPKAGGLLAFAAIFDVWKAPNGLEVLQCATVTCPPSEDVRDIHHRMGVLLLPDTLSIWLSGTEDEARGLMHPHPAGRLSVEETKGVDWTSA